MVFLPKILTITLSFFLSSRTSSTVPSNPLNGPSVTFTASPTTKGVIFSSSFSINSSTLPSIRLTSDWRSDVVHTRLVSGGKRCFAVELGQRNVRHAVTDEDDIFHVQKYLCLSDFLQTYSITNLSQKINRLFSSFLRRERFFC